MKRIALLAALGAALCCGPVAAERVVVDYGGPVVPALEKGFQLRYQKKPFVVDGRCYSACTMTADRARPYTCLTSGASLYFHRGRRYASDAKVVRRYSDGQVVRIEGSVLEENTDLTGYYSADIQQWIQGQGGLPADSGRFLEMPYKTALRFFRKCGKGEEWG